MLITFQSEATGDVMMFGDVAQQLLDIIGKTLDQRGIITVEQLPEAIRRLKQATAKSNGQHMEKTEDEQEKEEKTPAGGQRPYVSLAQRAFPLIELLERALKAKVPVTWGV